MERATPTKPGTRRNFVAEICSSWLNHANNGLLEFITEQHTLTRPKVPGINRESQRNPHQNTQALFYLQRPRAKEISSIFSVVAHTSVFPIVEVIRSD